MRVLRLFGILTVLALVVSACGGASTPGATPSETSASSPEPGGISGDLKIAILAPLSGPVPTFGVSTRDGALQAIEEWNDKGGVLGATIVPIVEDSQCTPDPSVNAAYKVIDQDGVKFLIGEVCSKASIPVSEIANAKGVLQITPTSTNPDVTLNQDGTTKPFVFRACFTDDVQGSVGAKFALEELGARTAFIMLDQANDYVKGLAEFFEAAFVAGGGEIVGKETYTDKDTDFSAILAKVADIKPDVVYLPDYYNIINLVTKQAKEKGITAPFMGGDGWDSPDLDGAAAEGGYFTNHYWPDDPRAEVQNFVTGYGERYKTDTGAPKTPDALATLAYDATNMLLQAIESAGTDDPAVVKDVLASITLDAVSGTISFDAAHNPIKPVTLVAVRDGKPTFHSQVQP